MMRLMHMSGSILTKRPLISLVGSIFLLLLLVVAPAAADTTVGGTISTDTTWTILNSPYIVTSNITVQGTDGADGITTLTVEPGVEVRVNSNRRINVGTTSGNPGALVARGEADNPIVFTSNQADPSAGDWYGIRFYATSDATVNLLEHCRINYAGFNNLGSLYFNNAGAAISNTIINHSGSYDLYYKGTVSGLVSDCTLNSGIYLLATSTVDFTGNTFHYSNSYPVKTDADNVHSLVNDNIFTHLDADSHLFVNGGKVTRDAIWTEAIPIYLSKNLTIQGTDGEDGITTLTLKPGAIIKLNTAKYIKVGATSGDPGALVARGEADNPIVFTSNQATPFPGDCYGIRFYDTSDDATTVMDHCLVEYCGLNYGALYMNNASPRILHTTIRNTMTAGIYAVGAGTNRAIISCNTFANYGMGIHWKASPALEMHNNNFLGNSGYESYYPENGTYYALYYTRAATLDARDNWWGDSAGPNQSLDTKVYGKVDTDPWSTTANECSGPGENHAPYEPSGPTPADGAENVSADSSVALSWTGGDPDMLDTVSYDFYWGTAADNLQVEASGLTMTAYTRTNLAQGSTYYWQVISKDGNGSETAGPIWHFRTKENHIALPDLIVRELSTQPAGHIQSGQTVTFTATVINPTNVEVGGITVDFLIDGVSIGAVATVPIISGDASLLVNKSWIYNGGDPTIQIVVDHLSAVEEANEDNNTLTTSFSAVTNINAPAAADDTAVTDEDTSVVIHVLDNDSDLDGDALTVSTFTQPANGAIANSDDGSFIYTPNSNFNGNDAFTYTVTDGSKSDNANVSVTINPVNDPPLADAGADQSVVYNALITLDGQGSSDPDGDVLTYHWSFSSRPSTSNATFVDSHAARPQFTGDVGGMYQVQLEVSDGSVTTADSVTITVLDPPSVRLTAAPPVISQGETTTLSWETSGAQVVRIDPDIGQVALNGSVTVSPQSATTYTLTATGPGGMIATTALVTIDTPFVLQIDAPLDQQTINRPDVLVRGVILNSTALETGVTVNGTATLQYQEQFMANHVPLVQGENTLTVRATDTAGQTYSTQITVYADIGNPYCTAATIPDEAGQVPLEGELSITAPTTLDSSTVLDYGPSDVVFGSSGSAVLHPFTINHPGLYRFEITANSSDSQTFLDEVAVLVQDNEQLDVLLRKKWNNMKSSLASGDIGAALEYIDPSSRALFEYNFNLLQDHLGDVVAGLQSVTLVETTGDQAVYNLVGLQGGQSYSFQLMFQKDGDGIWRIKFF